MLPFALRRMTRSLSSVSQRTQAITHQMMSTKAAPAQREEAPVIFESKLALRRFILNRPGKLNSLTTQMLELLRPQIEEWNKSDLCGVIVGTGARVFCAGGDVVAVANNAADPSTRHLALDFFHKEFELDYILAALSKPYVAVLDGHTMGGGVGLSVYAPFRVATEKTNFSMPETKIGYFPDVGASYFLSRLDGELGTYLGLTGEFVKGRAVFEHGLATHFVPSRRIPLLLDRLSAMDDPSMQAINATIEELSAEKEPDEASSPLSGAVRVALDSAFGHNNVEKIFKDLESFSIDGDPTVRSWASQTLASLHARSPTSLKVALEAIRRGKTMSLLEVLNMELRIATAFCSGATSDFAAGVAAVLIEKTGSRPSWSPSSLDQVTSSDVSKFFDSKSPFVQSAPQISVPEEFSAPPSRPMRWALPAEEEIGSVVRGAHRTGGSTGITLDELVSKFQDLRAGKLGVREKVTEVARRRCEVVDNSDGNFVWLKWKYPRGKPA